MEESAAEGHLALGLRRMARCGVSSVTNGPVATEEQMSNQEAEELGTDGSFEALSPPPIISLHSVRSQSRSCAGYSFLRLACLACFHIPYDTCLLSSLWKDRRNQLMIMPSPGSSSSSSSSRSKRPPALQKADDDTCKEN